MLCLFEDHLAEQFHPIALTRHLADLLVGTKTQRRRALAATGATDLTLHGRSHIRRYHEAQGDSTARPSRATLFVNARLPLTRSIVASFPEEEEWALIQDGVVAVARLSERSVAALDWEPDALAFPLDSIPLHELREGRLYEYIWDLIYDNGDRIVEDARESFGRIEGTVMEGATLIDRDGISIGRGTKIQPGVVLNAADGPIVIGEGAEIMANSVIVGPCFIGNHSKVKIGAKIYEKTSIGPWCKVGGEIENSIVLGYSNKQHDGFLGHSYLGRWVNLGADTNTSDLKNNYGAVRTVLNGREVDTGRMFLGSLIGDHAKTGINTMLNTGTVIGVAANVFGGGFPPKSIPSYAWGGSGEIYELAKALDVARRVMARRDVDFTEADERLLRLIFEQSVAS